MVAGCASTSPVSPVAQPVNSEQAPLIAQAPEPAEKPQPSIRAVPEVVEATRRYRKEYVLAPQDVVDVYIMRLPDGKFSSPIRSDGYISVPYAGEVKAAGLTPRELNEKLTELLSERLVNPEVTVIVREARPAVAYVTGEVGATAVVPLAGTTTAIQAIVRAGGFTTKAARDSVVLIRLTEEGRLTATRLNMVEGGQEAVFLALQNVPLQADDILFVPKTTIARVSTFLNDNINVILSGLNSVLSTYYNIRFIELIQKELQ